MTIKTLLENTEKAKEQAETLVETLTEQIDKLEAKEGAPIWFQSGDKRACIMPMREE